MMMTRMLKLAALAASFTYSGGILTQAADKKFYTIIMQGFLIDEAG